MARLWAQPENDQWNHPQILSASRGTLTNVFFRAGLDPGVENGWDSNIVRSVWYLWKAPEDGFLALQGDPLQIFLQEEPFWERVDPENVRPAIGYKVMYRVHAGGTYRLGIGARAFPDELDLRMTDYALLKVPQHDKRSSAFILLGQKGEAYLDTFGCTLDEEERSLGLGTNEDPVVWCRWTAPFDGTLILTNISRLDWPPKGFVEGPAGLQPVKLTESGYDSRIVGSKGTRYWFALKVNPSQPQRVWYHFVPEFGLRGFDSAEKVVQGGMNLALVPQGSVVSEEVESWRLGFRWRNADTILIETNRWVEEVAWMPYPGRSTLFGFGRTKSGYEFQLNPIQVNSILTNDFFAQRTRLSGYRDQATVVAGEATAEPGEPASSKFVWYEWTAPEDGIVTFHAIDQSFMPRVGLAQGTSVTNLQWLPDRKVEAGQNYIIALELSSWTYGLTFELEWFPRFLPHDNLEHARVLTGESFLERYIAEILTSQSDTPALPSTYEGEWHDLWYTWKPEVSGRCQFRGEIYEQVGNNTRDWPLVSFEPGPGTGVALQAGKTYYFRALARGVLPQYVEETFFRFVPWNTNRTPEAATALVGTSIVWTETISQLGRMPERVPRINYFPAWYRWKSPGKGRINLSGAYFVVYHDAQDGSVPLQNKVEADAQPGTESVASFHVEDGENYYLFAPELYFADADQVALGLYFTETEVTVDDQGQGTGPVLKLTGKTPLPNESMIDVFGVPEAVDTLAPDWLRTKTERVPGIDFPWHFPDTMPGRFRIGLSSTNEQGLYVLYQSLHVDVPARDSNWESAQELKFGSTGGMLPLRGWSLSGNVTNASTGSSGKPISLWYWWDSTQTRLCGLSCTYPFRLYQSSLNQGVLQPGEMVQEVLPRNGLSFSTSPGIRYWIEIWGGEEVSRESNGTLNLSFQPPHLEWRLLPKFLRVGGITRFEFIPSPWITNMVSAWLEVGSRSYPMKREGELLVVDLVPETQGTHEFSGWMELPGRQKVQSSRRTFLVGYRNEAPEEAEWLQTPEGDLMAGNLAIRPRWYRFVAPHDGAFGLSYRYNGSTRAALHTSASTNASTLVSNHFVRYPSQINPTWRVRAGGEYWLVIGASALEGANPLRYHYRFQSTPLNDDFESATPLPARLDRFPLESDMLLSSVEQGEAIVSPFQQAGTVWWSWDCPEKGFLLIRTNYYYNTRIWSGISLSNLTVVDSDSYFFRSLYPVTQGQRYFIQGVGITDTERGRFGTLVDFHPVPSNDSYQNPLLLTNRSVFLEGNLLGATLEAGEASASSDPTDRLRSIWYLWKPPVSGMASWNASYSSHGIYVKLWDEAECIDGYCLSNTLPNDVYWGEKWVEAGRLYRFCIGHDLRWTNESPYQVELNVSQTPPHDALQDREVLKGLTNTVRSWLKGATRESYEPDHGTNVGGSSVWYEWTPQRSGWVDVDLRSSSYNFALSYAVYESFSAAPVMDQLIPVHSAGRYPPVRDQWHAKRGRTYFIAVDSPLETVPLYLMRQYRGPVPLFSYLHFSNGDFDLSMRLIPDSTENPVLPRLEISVLNGDSRRVQLRVAGNPASPVILEISTDLMRWESIRVVQPDEFGVFLDWDPLLRGAQQGFFRVRSLE